jgi:type II restriction/modification system DNA methylase subunit YeeA
MRSKIITSFVVISVTVLSLYLFSGILLSPTEKFANVLEYYENQRLEISHATIEDLVLRNEIFTSGDVDINITKLPLNMFREKVSSGDYWGSRNSDINYDSFRQHIWVIGWDEDRYTTVVYYWSPRSSF